MNIPRLPSALLAAACCFGAVAAPEALAREVAIPHLFEDVAAAPAARNAARPETLRARRVRIDTAALEKARLAEGDVLALDLFGGAAFKAVLRKVEKLAPGKTAYSGRLRGAAFGTLNMVVEHGIVQASLTHPGGAYQVRYAGHGVHSIEQIDPASLPPDGEPLIPNTPIRAPQAGLRAAQDNSVAADDGSTIDVLVVYDAAARNSAGGAAAMSTLIDLAISETNTGYANSGIVPRVRLAHAEEVEYDETGFDWPATLNRLTQPGDGYLDSVQALRDAYKADEVVMLVDNGASCGLAWLMDTVSHDFESNAYALVSWRCATGNYSFGHELGHNMGADHDWFASDAVSSSYPYNKGYVNPGNTPATRWYTVMASFQECGRRTISCTRILYWSNPLKTYGNLPLGVADDAVTNCQAGNLNNPPCAADNVRVINSSAYTVANFRVAAQPACPVTLTPPSQPLPYTGGNATVQVAAPDNCAWTASVSGAPWLTVSSGATGQGNGTVTLKAQANPTAISRAGQLKATGDNAPATPIAQDARPGISIDNRAIKEGPAGATSLLRFRVTLSPAPTSPVTVNYATQNGTAKAGSDYQPVSGTLEFAKGVTAKLIQVPVIGDNLPEKRESLNVVLSAPSAPYALAKSVGLGLIGNDD